VFRAKLEKVRLWFCICISHAVFPLFFSLPLGKRLRAVYVAPRGEDDGLAPRHAGGVCDRALHTHRRRPRVVGVVAHVCVRERDLHWTGIDAYLVPGLAHTRCCLECTNADR
jgi:hypothetical protein